MIKTVKKIYKKIFWSNEKYARNLGVNIGKNCSIGKCSFGSEPYLVSIGDHVQVTKGVSFFTHTGGWLFRNEHPHFDCFGKIIVKDDVYIGNNVIILPGVTIAKNVIIGAGAVVTKSVSENSIVGGNPAKKIGDVNELKKRLIPYNLNTKGLNFNDKKDVLLSTKEDFFIFK